MQTTTLSLDNMHANGALYADLMQARQGAAVEDASATNPASYDQYDTPASRWVTVHRDGRVLAGVRLTPTTHRCGVYSYMVRDAQVGLIEGMPMDLLHDDAPVADHVWEASRPFVRDDVPQEDRRALLGELLGELVRAVRACGGTQVIGLLPAATPRLVRRAGLPCTPLGPVVRVDGANVVCASVSIQAKLH